MSTHNLCFEQKYKKSKFLSENFQLLEVKFSIYLNRCVFVMCYTLIYLHHKILMAATDISRKQGDPDIFFSNLFTKTYRYDPLSRGHKEKYQHFFY